MHQPQTPIIHLRLVGSNALWSVLTALLVVLALTSACSLLEEKQDVASTQEAIAAEAATLEPGDVPVKALSALRDVWDILENEFVLRDSLDATALTEGAVTSFLQATGIPALQDNPGFQETSLNRPDEVPKELDSFWDAWAGVFQEYNTIDSPLNPIVLSQAAVRGVIEALADPHTAYISPERYALDELDFTGEYQGVGSEVHNQRGRFILSPMPNSPAEAAGIRPGDLLMTVDGVSVDGWSILEVVQTIRGARDTTVILGITHLGQEQVEEIVIKRGDIDLTSVFWNMTSNGFAYLSLRAFYSNSDESLIEAIKEIEEQGARGIVLDLRNNPGGLLTTVVTIASQFLDDGVIVTEVDGEGNRKDWDVESNGVAKNFPLVVLVNQFSASASEVLSGALQDRKRAQIVGVTTFGKGSVNRLKPLSDGGALYYTYGRWYTPEGRLIEGLGLEPDVIVPQGVQVLQADPQLEKALELLEEAVTAAKS
jgi:carboxyl-terminal processing protease